MLAFRVKAEAWADKGPLLSLGDMSAQPCAAGSAGTPCAAADGSVSRRLDVVATLTRAALKRASDRRGHRRGDRSRRRSCRRRRHRRRCGARRRGDRCRRRGSHVGLRRCRTLCAGAEPGRCQRGSAADLAARSRRPGADRLPRHGTGRKTGARWSTHSASRWPTMARPCSDVLEMSRLGVVRGGYRPAGAAPCRCAGDGSVEREALETLRAIETAGWHDRGPGSRARVSPEVEAWLDHDHIGWRGPRRPHRPALDHRAVAGHGRRAAGCQERLMACPICSKPAQKPYSPVLLAPLRRRRPLALAEGQLCNPGRAGRGEDEEKLTSPDANIA